MAFRSVPRPSSPPGAKASTECPSYARDHNHHAQEPSSQMKPKTRQSSLSTQQCPTHRWTGHITPLNTPAADGRTIPLTENSPLPVRLATAARPETHQNLIDTSKEHATTATREINPQGSRPRHATDRNTPNAPRPNLWLQRETNHTQRPWRRSGSNR